MPMDFSYTTEPETPSVYHVLFECPEARNIKREHRELREPPASENRQPCQVCLDTIDDWIRDTQA
jgi:hypothetical protein